MFVAPGASLDFLVAQIAHGSFDSLGGYVLEEVIARRLLHAEDAHDVAAEVGGYDGSSAETRLARALSWVFSGYVLPRSSTADSDSPEFAGLCGELQAWQVAASFDDIGIAVEAKRAALLKKAAKLVNASFRACADMGACFAQSCGQGCRAAEEHTWLVREAAIGDPRYGTLFLGNLSIEAGQLLGGREAPKRETSRSLSTLLLLRWTMPFPLARHLGSARAQGLKD